MVAAAAALGCLLGSTGVGVVVAAATVLSFFLGPIGVELAAAAPMLGSFIVLWVHESPQVSQ